MGNVVDGLELRQRVWHEFNLHRVLFINEKLLVLNNMFIEIVNQN